MPVKSLAHKGASALLAVLVERDYLIHKVLDDFGNLGFAFWLLHAMASAKQKSHFKSTTPGSTRSPTSSPARRAPFPSPGTVAKLHRESSAAESVFSESVAVFKECACDL